jgi:RNA polymerase sigma-B factor
MTTAASPADLTESARRDQREDQRLRRQALTGDQHAHERLIEKHLPLAAQLARRYGRRGEPLDDLVQVARLALVKAAGRWDPRRGAFTTYAVPTILGELRRYFRDNTWVVRPPRRLQEACIEVAGARDALFQELGREPRVDDLVVRLGMCHATVVEALDAARGRKPVSLDRPLPIGGSASVTYSDALEDRRDDMSRCEDAVALSQLSAALTERDREVVRLRFQADMVQRDIAARMGCSQMHVSRILRESLVQMRLTADGATAQ